MEPDTAPRSTDPWILDDPAHRLREILRQGRCQIGFTLIALITDTSRALLGVRRIRTPEATPQACYDIAAGLRAAWMLQSIGEGHRIVDPEAALIAELRAAAEELCRDGRTGALLTDAQRSHLFTVVCREGFTVQTATEQQFRRGWDRCHLSEVGIGDVYVVTPDGWTGFMDNRCGLVPAVSAERSLRVVPDRS